MILIRHIFAMLTWNNTFTKREFIDFFINIIYSLKQGQPNCKFLLTIIKKNYLLNEKRIL